VRAVLSALSWLVILAIRAYRAVISPLLGPRCRFVPSCSEYAIESVREHGPLLGLVRTFQRLGRCHPFHPGGFDPVPKRADHG